MNARFIIYQIILVFGCTSLTYGQSNSYFSDVTRKIKRVENSLMNWVQTPDTSLRWSIEERMKYHQINGLSIAIIHNYTIEWAKGYGWADMSEKRKVTSHTLFQAASITKSLNAVGVLKLVQDGKLDLNADINQYLRLWKFPYDSLAGNKKITVKNLLNHTAGLSVSGFPGYSVNDSLPSLIQILDGKHPSKTQAVRSELAPGLKYQYSGGGTCISQLIISDITNQTYSDYMFQNVLKPLNMNESFFSQPPPENKKALIATGYYKDGSAVEGKFRIYPELAAGGLWTNPTDLCKYIIETQLSYQGKSSKVLSTEMTKIRLTPFKDYSALGVFVENVGNDKYFFHSGGNTGFMSEYRGDLQNGNGVVIMLNSDNRTIIQEIINSVAYVYHWEDFYKPIIKNVISLPDSVLSRYEGEYLFGDKKMSVIKKNKKLFIVEDWPWELYFTSENDFFVSEVEGNFRFKQDIDRKVTGILDINSGRTANRIVKDTSDSEYKPKTVTDKQNPQQKK